MCAYLLTDMSVENLWYFYLVVIKVLYACEYFYTYTLRLVLMSSYLWPLAFTAAQNVLVHIANAVANTEP